MCQIKVFSAPFAKESDRDNCILLVLSSFTPQITSDQNSETEKRKEKTSLRDLSDLPIQYERIVMEHHNQTDKASSLSKFCIL